MKDLNKLHSDTLVWLYERNLQEAPPVNQMCKLMEEVGELAKGMNKQDYAQIVDGIGDVLVVMTVLCEQLNLDMSSCWESAYNEIKNRKGKLINGTFVKEN